MSESVDRTLASLLEDFEDVLEATRKEDLSRRMNLDRYGGDAHRLASGINELLSVVTGLLGHFSVTFRNSSESLASASESLNENMNHIAGDADQTRLSNDALNSRIQQTRNNASEMTIAIQEISRNAGHVAQNATEVREGVGQTEKTVSDLVEASLSINDITKSISMIAQQTNLLALSATIEAARAGDAGRGFAVVAGEVKELSKETAMATNNVGEVVGNIQKMIEEVKNSISSILERSDALNESSSSIASSVEEQSAVISGVEEVLNELHQSSEEIGEKMNRIHSNVNGVISETQELSGMSRRQGKRSSDLSELVGSAIHEDFIPWNSSYSVGIQSVDDEHKRIFRYINDLYQAVVTGQTENIQTILEDLAAYTIQHFRREEHHFEATAYPETNQHKKIHATLIEQLSSSMEKFKAGEMEVDYKLLNFLKNWLNIHIKKEDMAYAPHLKIRGVV